MSMLKNFSNVSKNLNISTILIRNYAKPANMLGRRNVDTSKSELDASQQITKLPESTEEVAPLSGVPDDYITERLVRIFVPSKNAMQSGTFKTNKWRLEFDNRERWENPLMGWSSSGDSVSNINLEFTDKQDAIMYCDRMGYKYFIDEKHEAERRPKSYGVNFSWNKKTRVNTK